MLPAVGGVNVKAFRRGGQFVEATVCLISQGGGPAMGTIIREETPAASGFSSVGLKRGAAQFFCARSRRIVVGSRRARLTILLQALIAVSTKESK